MGPMSREDVAIVVQARMSSRRMPGKVLAPLARRIVDGLQGHALVDRASIEQSIAAVKGA
jgi:spore coat polysaccharide biosynthesis protein SpsF (cytidylyltransferase family)